MIDSSFVHPAIFFIVLALVLPLLRGKGWKWLLPVPALLAVWSVLRMQVGTFGPVEYLGLKLTLGRVDSLSLIFANVFAIQAAIGFIYAMHVRDKGQHVAAALYVAGSFGCTFAGDYVTLFIFWELMSIASTFLVWLNRNPASTKAGYRYFLFHTMGGLFLLAGLLLRYQAVGSFEFVPVAQSAARFYDYLILIGFCVNAAVVPLHAWLPDAYPEATVTGAVFMSAFTTKTAVYVLARAFAGYEVLAIMGVVMTLYGVFYATIENNARRILAYHIVSQVGYMVAGIGIGTQMTINGACAHAYAHILYKGLLFMGAGCVLYAAGTAKLNQLGGLAARIPLVMVGYMIGAVSISGFPLFNGFVSKTMTITGAAASGHGILAILMEVAAVGTFLSVGIKLPYFAFWGGKKEYSGELRPVPWNMYLGMALGGSLCFLQGVYPSLLYRFLPFPVEYVPWTPWHVLQSMLLLSFTGLGFYLLHKKLTPEAKINLDFDYFYRLAGRLVLTVAKVPIELVDNRWTEVYRQVGLRGLLGMGWLTSVFDKKGIDGVLDNGAYGVRNGGSLLARVQTGRLQDYLAGTVVAALVVVVLLWFFY
ncbi:MAG: Na(+)/H(+) antiporter subunit D [bacterium]